MPKNYDYPVEYACPHDGWYNGNPKLMIANGTFADYRHRLVEWVRRGKMTQHDLDVFDKQWAGLPIQTKRDRRNKVLESIKKVPDPKSRGEYISSPSDNGLGIEPDKVPQLRRKATIRQPLGSIDSRPDPFDAEEAAERGANALEELGMKHSGVGHAVPQSVPASMVATPMAPQRAPALATAVA